MAISSPTYLISERRVRRNIQRMADRAEQHGLDLRPHFKTHQHPVAGRWFRDFGVEEIAVTSLRMAREFAEDWRRITMAMPLNPRELPELAAFSAGRELTVFLTDSGVAKRLSDQVTDPLGYYIEIDAGYGRTGIEWTDTATVRVVIDAAGPHRFRGFYVHAGDTYDAGGSSAKGRSGIAAIHERTLVRLADLRQRFEDLPALEVVIGDTPACSTQENFSGISAIGPGNFVYYDLVQAKLGSCSLNDIAVCAVLPIVQSKPGGAIVHGGWVQLGRDRGAGARFADGRVGSHHGAVVRVEQNSEGYSWSADQIIGWVTKLSQEHGTIAWAGDDPSLRPGDLVGVLPVHACALVHSMRIGGAEPIFGL